MSHCPEDRLQPSGQRLPPDGDMSMENLNPAADSAESFAQKTTETYAAFAERQQPVGAEFETTSFNS